MIIKHYYLQSAKPRFFFFLAINLALCIINSNSLVAQIPALQWAREIQGSSNEQIGEIKTDASGNIYITGVFSGTVDFNPATGSANVFNVSSNGDYDGFLVKLDSLGIFQWVITLGDADDDAVIGVDFDSQSNVIITGWITGSADVDPGTGVQLLSSSPASASDIFVISYSSSGMLNWAGSMGGNFDDYASDVRIKNGRVVVSGSYAGGIDLDFGAGSAQFQSNGARDGFVSVYSESGSYIWGVSIGDNNFDYTGTLAIGNDGRIYVEGAFEGTVDFDPGPGAELASSGANSDAFIWVLDSLGNYIAVYLYTGSGIKIINDFLVDANGNIYLTGSLTGTMDIDPGAAVNSITSSGGGDAFTSKISSTGSFVWGFTNNGNDDESGEAIAFTPNGDLVLQTLFYDNIDADPSTTTQQFTSAGYYDILLSCIDTAQGLIWAFKIGGTGSDLGLAMDVGIHGTIYSGGTFQSTVDFDPGPATVNLTAPAILYFDSYIAAYTIPPAGNNQDESLLSHLQIFPSPSSGNFTLRCGSEMLNGTLIVSDLSGREIIKQQLNSNSISSFYLDGEAGVYFATVITEDGKTGTVRIIKE